MDHLNDLDDDCLLLVLDLLPPKQLFKMLGVNKRFNRLAADKLRVRIKVISFSRCFKSVNCSHLRALSQDQELILEPVFRTNIFEDPSRKALFSSVLSKCDGVKSIDFDDCVLPYDVLLEMVQNCPELECLKLGKMTFEEHEWLEFLDRIGHQIVHFAKVWLFNCDDEMAYQPCARLLKAIACKCPNIKQIDWAMDEFANEYLIEPIKELPKSCWVSLNCEALAEDIFENVDKLTLKTLDWSLLGNRVDRLSSLKCHNLLTEFGPVHGVEFAGLKILDLSKCMGYSEVSINCLVVSQFPCLEEFRFSVTSNLEEDDYNALFRRMVSVKKLVMSCNRSFLYDVIPQFPMDVVYFSQLENLETIHLKIWHVPEEYPPEDITWLIDQYVNGIDSLKKLSVDLWHRDNFVEFDEWEETLEKEVKRLKMEQNRVDLTYKSK